VRRASSTGASAIAHFCTRAGPETPIGGARPAFSVHHQRFAADSLGITLNYRPDTMNTAHSHYSSAASSRRAAMHLGAIDWEELPSMADVALRLVASGPIRHVDLDLSGGHSEPGALDTRYRPRTTWDNTMAADLDALAPTEPFRETLQGLETREVREPDVFRHFFG
jgi:hypothetical protein